VQDTLKSYPPENKVMKRASLAGVSTTTIFYVLCGCIGYAAFGNDAPGNFLTGFGFYEPFWLIDFANVCIAIHLIGAYQVFCQPIFGFIEMKCRQRWPDSKFITTEHILNVPFYGDYYVNMFRLVWRTAYVIMTAVIAMIFPFFNSFLGLIGAGSFYPLTVYFPIEMYIARAKIQRFSFTWVWLKILSWVCLVVSLVAAIGSVQGLLTDVSFTVRIVDEGLRASGVKVAGVSYDFVADNSNQPEGGSNILHEESSQRKVFSLEKMSLLIVKRYILNAWKKYGVKRFTKNKNGFFFIRFSCATGLEGVWEHGSLLIRNAPFILRMFTSKRAKYYRHSSWHPRYARFGYNNHMYAILGRMDYARALVDIRVGRALRDTMMISVPFPGWNDDRDHLVIKMGREKGNEKLIDDLVDGFASPNPFDVLTKEDEKSILRDLKESDDDANVENGYDEATTSSKSLDNSKDDKSTFRDLQESDDGVDVENGYDEITTSSKSLARVVLLSLAYRRLNLVCCLSSVA
ncbi:amino acid permease 6-like protein, partial [Tanacetum coccineum]